MLQRTVTTHERRHRPTQGEPTYRDLYEEAKRKGIEGRSKMSKSELKRVLGR